MSTFRDDFYYFHFQVVGGNFTFSEIKAISCTDVSMECIPPASRDCEHEVKEESVEITCRMNKNENQVDYLLF